ncbi:uncharacterized oxidoreductase YkwC-like isoform X2 [Hylaeus volcanicus]|nr:uncharacterized oxidoreductase YkwC-like isoform X2 [Hylaeus volcanicus]
MGLPMCCNLIRYGGHKVFVTSRTASKCERAIALGATFCDTPADLIQQNVHVIISIVGFPHETKDIVYGKNGILQGLDINTSVQQKRTPIFIDMSTGDPTLAKEIHTTFEKLGSYSFDAPVSGGDVGAENRALAVFVGGNNATVFQKLEPLIFQPITDVTKGGRIQYIGKSGEGHQAKIVNQIFIANTMIGMCEGIFYARKVGLPLPQTLNAIEKGAAGSWSLSNLAPRLLDNNYSPGFYVEHFVKDLSIALQDATRLNLHLPGLTLAHALYTELLQKGYGKLGTQALLKRYEFTHKE